jgi:hypothetical protein
MAWVMVESYYVRYNTKERQAVVGVYYREGGSVEGRMLSQHFPLPPADAAFLTDLLRNEKPVYLDVETGALATGKELVGEGETVGSAAGAPM